MSGSSEKHKAWTVVRWLLVVPGALCAGLAIDLGWTWYEQSVTGMSSQPIPTVFVYPVEEVLILLALGLAGAFVAPKGRPPVFLSLTGIVAVLMMVNGDCDRNAVAFGWAVVVGFPIAFWGPRLASRRRLNSKGLTIGPRPTRQKVWMLVRWVLVVPVATLVWVLLGWLLTPLFEWSAEYYDAQMNPVAGFLNRLTLVVFYLGVALAGAFIAPSARPAVFLVLVGTLAMLYMVNGEWMVEGVALCFTLVFGLSILYWSPKIVNQLRSCSTRARHSKPKPVAHDE